MDTPNGHPDQAVEVKQENPLPPHESKPSEQQPPTSPPKATEDELDAALNGQEPTSKNLILAAIGVMKVSYRPSHPLHPFHMPRLPFQNRKARPDSKRISNWINRRYGRSLK